MCCSSKVEMSGYSECGVDSNAMSVGAHSAGGRIVAMKERV